MFMVVSVFIIKKNDSLIKHRLFLLASQSDKDTFDGAQEEIEKEYHEGWQLLSFHVTGCLPLDWAVL